MLPATLCFFITLFHHVPRQFHHVDHDHAAEVDVHDRVAGLESPILLFELLREGVGHFRYSGVGEYHVNFSDPVEYSAHYLPVQDVAFEEVKIRVEGLLIIAGGTVAVQAVDFCSASGENFGGGMADSGCST